MGMVGKLSKLEKAHLRDSYVLRFWPFVEVESMIFSSIKHARPLNPFLVVSVTTAHAMKIHSSVSQVQSIPPGQMRSTIPPECAISVVLQDMPMNKSPHVPNPLNLLDPYNIDFFKLHLKLHLSFLNSISFLQSTSCSQYPIWVIFGHFRHRFPVLTLDLMARSNKIYVIL